MDIKHIVKKLKSSRGETISEVLVSSLIAALAMIMFASMVIASRNIIEKSRDTISDYYKGTSRMVTKDGVDSGSGTLNMDSALVYHADGKDSYGITVYTNQASTGDGAADSMKVKRYE